MQWTTPHWYGDSPLDPFDVRIFDENAICSELAFITSQEKPDPRLAVEAEIEMGLLQIRIALLCAVALSVALALNSMTGRVQDGNFPTTHGHSALRVCRTMALPVWAVQNVSLSDAAAAGEASSMVNPSRKFAYVIV